MPNLDGAYTCMFCACVGHLDEFCFQHKRIEKRSVDYSRNSYHNEFIDSPPHISSGAPSHFSCRHNYHSYGFGSQESGLVPRRFCVDPCSHCGARPCVGTVLPLEVPILTLI
jgi:hypothetical protein